MKNLLTCCACALLLTALDARGAETDLKDQTSVAVTVYNNGLALVRDIREVSLSQGELDLKFMDVAEQIRPETVSLRSLSQPGSVVILEQNYEYDLISPDKLMEKYVGKEVRLVNYDTENQAPSASATLLSVNGGPVYQVGDKIHLGYPGDVILPEIPENLIAKPTLIWKINNRSPEQTLEATYLANGISWKADYVLTLARTDRELDLAGWVTMNNQSGATYEKAKLKLVAGDVNVVRERPKRMRGAGGAQEVALAIETPMPEEEAFAEYHLYTMPRRTTIKQNQSKQLALLSASGVACEKIYEYRGQVSYYSQRIPRLDGERVSVYLKFQNEEENGMGMPLPAGVMRIYQEDSEGMLQFAGEDRIEHTPKDEEVRLRMGQAFDVVAERVQTDFSRISDRVFEAAFEITLRNHKEMGVTVDVVEPMPADWEILDQSHDHTKKDAHTAIFSVDVPADGETVVEYRVRVRY